MRGIKQCRLGADFRSDVASEGQAGTLLLLSIVLLLSDPCYTFAQTRGFGTPPPQMASAADSTLPDAPSAAPAAASEEKARPVATGAALPEASAMRKYIQPGQMVPPLTPGDKILFGLHNTATLFAATGWVAAAGWEQFRNGSPNYNGGARAYGQRVGAAALRNASEDLFSDAIVANATREDPRYYVLGPGHSPVARVVYAVSRTLVTRTDSGRATPNIALIGGNFGGALLTNAYYPAANRGTEQTLETFGKSLAASAFGFTVREFWGEVRNRSRESDRRQGQALFK